MKNTETYNELVQKMRTFFQNKGFKEVPTQSRLSILAACENPHSITTFNYQGEVWPLPQTGQMWLEYELLKNPEWNGVYCISTSYRQEKDPIPGRHSLIFPMFEVESKGTMSDLINLESELLEYLGFDKPITVNYDDVCEEYGGVPILENEHETRMWEEKGSSVSLQFFPLRTNPFWNMKKNSNGYFNKVDVILYGQETIGSAERSCNVEEMREMFYTIENGNYSAKLFELFGKERVEKELNEFLSLKFFPRFGWGCGLTRLERAYELMMKEKEITV
ncbi:Aminoacyl-tRNA synthetase, class II (D/K/N) [uncultured Caudovirales phage]|uniref:Aminoacyl-tRNA synthetase, class II (D/K/N) n=1 Tax=uncultured Caudovirales phage TaxID=2100421 RepID=A0A6J5LBC1_9CAUD|nr:Aminoacyl-tRNA synthetase, class II (D/K/N) [uncultured Caudovirales phage]